MKDGRESMGNISKKKKISKKLSTRAFDNKFDRNEDIFKYLDFEEATVVKKVNVDFPAWMVDLLDKEAVKLNVSRQAIIKMWIRDRLDPSHRIA